jgi:Zn-dependent protease with chaperone function
MINWIIYFVGFWIVSLGTLFIVGAVLSWLTLRMAEHSQTAVHFEVRRGERWLRAVYRTVIALTGLYFYVSIPFLILIVLALAGGIAYLFILVRRIPLRLAVFLAIATLYTLYAILRSVFTRVREEEPGCPLTRDEAPRLWSLTEEVAERVDTRPVDAVYVTPAASIGVTERGSLLSKLRGTGRRCLILGLGALPGMTQGQFKAILAHEYGHFSNRDTAGGNLARQVQASIYQMAYSLASTGQARWYNPAWLFINGFHRVFLCVALGASRLQEILADRYAVLAYGARDFIDGLMHIVRQSLTFDAQVSQEIRAAVGHNRALQNLYVLPPVQGVALKQLEAEMEQQMNRLTSTYDSHPAIQDRLKLVQQLNVGDEIENNQEPAWDLLPDAESLQEEMTAHVQQNVQRQAQIAQAVRRQRGNR